MLEHLRRDEVLVRLRGCRKSFLDAPCNIISSKDLSVIMKLLVLSME
jgi:hypothetical protein